VWHVRSEDRTRELADRSRRPIVVKAIAVLVVAALAAVSCGSDPEPVAVTTPDSPDPTSPASTVSASTSPMTSGSPPSTTIIEVAELVPGIECDRDLDAFIDAPFAFVGTVSGVRGEILPWDVDAENPNRPQNPEPTRWVSFDVDGWFTVDWGTGFSVWMPVHDAAVGDRLAVGGDARYVSIDGFSGQSGEVEFCTLSSVHQLRRVWRCPKASPTRRILPPSTRRNPPETLSPATRTPTCSRCTTATIALPVDRRRCGWS
jgi:hypothetical protein